MSMTTKELAWKLGLLRKRSSSSEDQGLKRIQKTRQIFKYLIIIDFEATCWQNSKERTQEIIEFPAVLLNTSNGAIESEFHYYLQPQEHPTLSPFCKELTGITQDQVDQGIPLAIVLRKFSTWLKTQTAERGIIYDESSPQGNKCTFVTWSDWDLAVCLHYEARRKQLRKPPELNSWIDLRATYRSFYQRRPQGLNGALQDLGIQFEGREHSGVCDARNTAKLAWRMMTDGCILKITKCLDGGKGGKNAAAVPNNGPQPSIMTIMQNPQTKVMPAMTSHTKDQTPQTKVMPAMTSHTKDHTPQTKVIKVMPSHTKDHAPQTKVIKVMPAMTSHTKHQAPQTKVMSAMTSRAKDQTPQTKVMPAMTSHTKDQSPETKVIKVMPAMTSHTKNFVQAIAQDKENVTPSSTLRTGKRYGSCLRSTNLSSNNTPDGFSRPGIKQFKTPTEPTLLSRKPLGILNTLRTPIDTTLKKFPTTVYKRTPPLCECGRRANRKVVQNPGPNQGRVFYSCPNGRSGNISNKSRGRQNGCRFFKWEVQDCQSAGMSPAFTINTVTKQSMSMYGNTFLQNGRIAQPDFDINSP